MKAAALVYLRDNAAAQRLVVAWPLVSGRDAEESQVAAEWASLADVPRHRVPGIAKVLRAHGICLPDGTVDPLAEKFVENQVARALGKKPR